MNSFKGARAFQIELEFGSVGFWGEGKTGVPRSKGENQEQTQPTYGVDAGSWTRATLMGGECSHHCATLAPLDDETNIELIFAVLIDNLLWKVWTQESFQK